MTYCCLLDVAALLVAVATTTQVFWDVEPAAGKLLLPYLAWTAYATLLNAWIWNKNPKVGFTIRQAVLRSCIWCSCDGFNCMISLSTILHACNAHTSSLYLHRATSIYQHLDCFKH